MLFVEGDPSRRGKLDADSFFLRALFLDAAKGYDVVQRGPQELEQPTLDQYPTVYLLNVPRLSEKAKSNLEAYVRNGGGVCFCLGEQVNIDYYNQQLSNQLPTENAKYQKYATLLKNHQRRIKEVLATGKQLYQLANAIESLLTDTSDPKDPQKPNLREFWQMPEQGDLAEKFARLM